MLYLEDLLRENGFEVAVVGSSKTVFKDLGNPVDEIPVLEKSMIYEIS